MSNIHVYFTFASLDFTFTRANEVRQSNKADIHLSHGRASERYGAINSMTSLPKFFQNYNDKEFITSSKE